MPTDIADGHCREGYYSIVAKWWAHAVPLPAAPFASMTGYTAGRDVGGTPQGQFEDKIDFSTRDAAMEFCIAKNIAIAKAAGAKETP